MLLVTRNLPPLLGGMERLNWHLLHELAASEAVSAVGPAGAAARAPAGVAVEEVPVAPLPRFLAAAALRSLRAARRARPGVVLAGSGLTAPIALGAARAAGRTAAAVAYVHGLDVVVDHAAYRALWMPALRRVDRVIANSRATADACAEAGIDPARIGVVHPGVETAVAAPVPQAVAAFRAAQRLGEGPVLLSVGRLTARKALREFVAGILPRIVARHPGATLVVVGGLPSQALSARAQTPRSILAAAEAAGIGGHVRCLGQVTDDDLRLAWQAADVHVFPVRAIPGDPEGFGMVAVEAAAHGVPTVAFACGGIPDAVADGVSGRLLPPGDDAGFADAVDALLRTPLPWETLAGFAARFSWPRFGAAIARELDAAVAARRG